MVGTEVFTIKPLEWKLTKHGDHEATSPLGTVWIAPVNGCAYQWAVGHVRRASQSPTFEAAKSAAEAYYRKRMMEGLAPVTPDIAAAPDLLAALEEWFIDYDGWSPTELQKRYRPDMIAKVERTRAAIEKAKGSVSGGSVSAMTDREKLDWFEENYCATCPRFSFTGGDLCPGCPHTKDADAALAMSFASVERTGCDE